MPRKCQQNIYKPQKWSEENCLDWRHNLFAQHQNVTIYWSKIYNGGKVKNRRVFWSISLCFERVIACKNKIISSLPQITSFCLLVACSSIVKSHDSNMYLGRNIMEWIKHEYWIKSTKNELQPNISEVTHCGPMTPCDHLDQIMTCCLKALSH